MRFNENQELMFWVMLLLIFIFIGGTVVFWNKYESEKTIKQSYLEELKEVTSENTELKEQVETLTKGNKNIVPIIRKLRPQLDEKIVNDIAETIVKYSREYRIPPEFVTYLIQRESNFNVLAVSSKGAVGLMQIMPSSHQDKTKKMGITNGEIYHIDNNIKLGCWILREYYDESDSIEKALARYVGGSNNGYIDDILIGYTNETIPRTKKIEKEKGSVVERYTR